MRSSLSTLCFYKFLSTGFYSGLSPKAPGTAGTAAAGLLAAAIFNLFPHSYNPWVSCLIAASVIPLAIWITNKTLKLEIFSQSKDPQAIVIDEFAGYFVAIAGLGSSWEILLLGFVLFRFFDITKLPPIKNIEKLPGAYGVVLDDVLAGVYANLAARILLACFYSGT